MKKQRETGYEVPPQSRKSIHDLSYKIRALLNIEGPWFPIIEFLEKGMLRIDKDFYFGVAFMSDLGERHGITIPSQRTILLREDVYSRAYEGHGRDRFTACHELGHYLLRHQISLARKMNGTPTKIYMNSEWQADFFAAEILIPIRNPKLWGYSIEDIMTECGVSQEAARIAFTRIQDIKKAS